MILKMRFSPILLKRNEASITSNIVRKTSLQQFVTSIIHPNNHVPRREEHSLCFGPQLQRLCETARGTHLTFIIQRMSPAEASQINETQRQYFFYASLFLFITGTIGNLLNILVFRTLRCFRGNQCAFGFVLESMSNIGIVVSIFPAYFYEYSSGVDPATSSIVWCKLKNGLSDMFGLCSMFTICFQTFDQFMVTNPRPSYRRVSSLKLAHRVLACNVIFVVLHTLPFMILAEINASGRCKISNSVMNTYSSIFYYPVLSCALPIITTVTLSLFAYRNVRRIVRRQISVERRRLDRQLTAMVLARVLSLILLGLPYIGSQLYRVNVNTATADPVTLAVGNLLNAITNTVLYLNFAVRQVITARDRRLCFVFVDDILSVPDRVESISSTDEASHAEMLRTTIGCLWSEDAGKRRGKSRGTGDRT